MDWATSFCVSLVLSSVIVSLSLRRHRSFMKTLRDEVRPIQCWQCKTEVRKDSRYCRSCGIPLSPDHKFGNGYASIRWIDVGPDDKISAGLAWRQADSSGLTYCCLSENFGAVATLWKISSYWASIVSLPDGVLLPMQMQRSFDSAAELSVRELEKHYTWQRPK